MEVRLVHENKLKIILSPSDAEELGLDTRQIDQNNEDARRALLAILELAGREVPFESRGGKLFIESYPCEGGGCVLYFTRLHRTPAGKAALAPVVFQFDNAEEMIQGLCAAYVQCRHRIFRSALYWMEERYRLVVYPLDYADRRSVYFLAEYGERVGEGELAAAYTGEHGEALLEEDALETIWKYFGGD